MTLGPYNGMMLAPGMGQPAYTVEHDIMGMIYGPPHHCVFLTHAIIDGASRDAGNTADTTTLRPGLIMAQVTATQKWKPYVTGQSDGTEIPAGILTILGLNTQMDGANTDRFLATIMIKGNVNPEALCIAASSSYGVDKATASHIVVRQAFLYNFMFSDDFMNYTAATLANRNLD
jgi:hypothetical protein